MKNLFREEAIAEQNRRLQGEVILVQPVTARVLAPILCALLIAAVCFLASAEYARTETVAGYVSPTAGMSTVIPPRPGVVAELTVGVGDRVRKGELLLRVASESTLADGAGLESALQEDLQRQRLEIEAAIAAEERTFAEQQRQRETQIRGIGSQLEQMEGLRAVAEQRWQITEDRRARFENLLAKGVVSRAQHQQRQEESLSLQREIRDLDMKRLQLEGQRSQLQSERATAPSQHEEKKAGLRLQLSELDARRREIEGRSSYSITAPMDGVVASLSTGAGASVTPGSPVAVIMPEDAALEAVLLVPTRAAGMLELGLDLGVKYAAFPYQKFGIARGVISDVETAILNPNQIGGPVQSREPVYRVKAALDSQHVTAFGRDYPLQIGMLLDAEIVIDRRSLLQWILDPIYSLSGAPETA